MKETSIFLRIVGKLSAIIFFVSLFCLGVSFCLKPICTQTVQNLVLNETVTDYLTDGISQENKVSSNHTADSTETSSQGTNIEKTDIITKEQIEKVEEIVQSSPELRDLASEYLEQYAQYMEDGVSSIPESQKEELMNSVNEDILDVLEDESSSSFTESDRQRYKTALEEKEQAVFDTLDEMPSALEQTMPDAAAALKTYGKAVSMETQAGLAAAAIITGILLMICRRYQFRWAKSIGVFTLIDGLLIAFAVPYIAEILSGFLTNQLLGRTGDIDTGICSQIGGGMITAGILLIAFYMIYHRKRKTA